MIYIYIYTYIYIYIYFFFDKCFDTCTLLFFWVP